LSPVLVVNSKAGPGKLPRSRRLASDTSSTPASGG
jgi:hypothetical protein